MAASICVCGDIDLPSANISSYTEPQLTPIALFSQVSVVKYLQSMVPVTEE